MALNFPTNPNINDVYSSGNRSWIWDGTVWNVAQGLLPYGGITVPSDVSQLTDTTNLIPDSLLDLGIVDGTSGQALTTDGAGNFTFATISGGGGGGNAFTRFAADTGETTADDPADTLTVQGGTNISTTIAGDILTVDFNGTISANFSELTDVSNAGINVSTIYESAIATLTVDNIGTQAYTFLSHYTGSNPNLYALAGTTIAFNLNGQEGHPFAIQDPFGNNLSTGLVHVSSDGTVSVDSAAQGKETGVLYWRINEGISGGYRYQCLSHPAMVGAITVKRLSTI